MASLFGCRGQYEKAREAARKMEVQNLYELAAFERKAASVANTRTLN